MFRRASFVAALGLGLLPALALAQIPYGGFAPTGQDLAQREMGQRDRIEDGIRSGRITRDEARDLRRDQRRIRDMIQDARYDGYVDVRERDRIERQLARQDRRISRQRRDDDRRWDDD